MAPRSSLPHGRPYGIHGHAAVAPPLAAGGHRVLAPYPRGHGTTRFIGAGTVRGAQRSAVALDVVALMDTLGIGSAVLGGFGWGARTAEAIAAPWPERGGALVSASGHRSPATRTRRHGGPGRGGPGGPSTTSPARGWRGSAVDRRDFVRSVWRNLFPGWDFDDATFERTVQALDNPDRVDIAARGRQWRLGLADGDPRFDRLEARLVADPTIAVPTIVLDAELDPFTRAEGAAAYWGKFIGKLGHRTLPGIGHNIPQEAPAAFAEAVINALHL
jgi:pimeloyl-ACP methyl ester carboxylesterase